MSIALISFIKPLFSASFQFNFNKVAHAVGFCIVSSIGRSAAFLQTVIERFWGWLFDLAVRPYVWLESTRNVANSTILGWYRSFSSGHGGMKLMWKWLWRPTSTLRSKAKTRTLSGKNQPNILKISSNTLWRTTLKQTPFATRDESWNILILGGLKRRWAGCTTRMRWADGNRPIILTQSLRCPGDEGWQSFGWMSGPGAWRLMNIIYYWTNWTERESSSYQTP